MVVKIKVGLLRPGGRAAGWGAWGWDQHVGLSFGRTPHGQLCPAPEFCLHTHSESTFYHTESYIYK